MAEYIEREALLKDIENDKMTVLFDKTSAIHHVKNQPAADVAEVRHGKWEVVFDGNAKLYENMFECSVCKTTHVGHPNVGRYCPHCGADMRSDEE